jgi:hypothetical protein
MPASKTLELERRIGKLERELAAYKRQLQKNDSTAGTAARELRLRLVSLRMAVHKFFDESEAAGIDWTDQPPPVAGAAQELLDLALSALMAEAAAELGDAPATNPKTPTPPRTKRTPR